MNSLTFAGVIAGGLVLMMLACYVMLNLTHILMGFIGMEETNLGIVLMLISGFSPIIVLMWLLETHDE